MTLLDEVAAAETRLAPLRDLWRRGGTRPGPELCRVLAAVAERIERLARSLAGAEQEATRRQQGLAPQLDALIRGREMRRAYGGAQVGALPSGSRVNGAGV
jgi:hypothetical protein